MKPNNYQSKRNLLENGKKYVEIKDVAKKFFVDISTVRYWIAQRMINAFRSNGRWFILADSVENFEQVLLSRKKRRKKKKRAKK